MCQSHTTLNNVQPQEDQMKDMASQLFTCPYCGLLFDNLFQLKYVFIIAESGEGRCVN